MNQLDSGSRLGPIEKVQAWLIVFHLSAPSCGTIIDTEEWWCWWWSIFFLIFFPFEITLLSSAPTTNLFITSINYSYWIIVTSANLRRRVFVVKCCSRPPGGLEKNVLISVGSSRECPYKIQTLDTRNKSHQKRCFDLTEIVTPWPDFIDINRITNLKQNKTHSRRRAELLNCLCSWETHNFILNIQIVIYLTCLVGACDPFW